MTTTRAIAHNSIIQIVGKVATTMLGLVALGMMTRYLGNEQFGWYTSVIAFLQFIGIMTDFGMTPVTAQMMSEPGENKERLFQNLLGFRVVTAIVAFSLAPAIAFFFPYPAPVKMAILFSSLSFVAIAINQVFLGFYQTRLQTYIPVVGELAGRLFLVLSIAFLIFRGESFLPIMGAVTISSLIFTSVVALYVRRHTSFRLAFDRPVWREIVRKSWPISLAIICNVVYLKGDIVLMEFFVPSSDIGIYGAAYRVLDVITQSGMMLMGVFLPLLAFAWSRNDRGLFRTRYQQAAAAIALLGIPAVIGGIMLATPLMRLVAGDDFIPSGPILQILLIAVIGVFLGAIYGHLSVAINKQRQTLWIFFATAVLTVAGYLIFIPRYGIYGAAWMSVFSELFTGVLLFLMVSRYAGEALQYRTIMKIMAASAVMGFILFILPAWPVLILILIGISTYALALYLLGGISKQTLKEILSLKPTL